LTLEEHWTAEGGRAEFTGTEVIVFKNDVEIARMPTRFFPIKQDDFQREVEFVVVDPEDGHNGPTTIARLK
jgi:hypothetical protein